MGCWYVMPSELEQRIGAVSAERSVVTLTLDPVVLVDRSRQAGSFTHRLGRATRRATGSPTEFRGDVLTTAKQDSAPVTGWTARAATPCSGSSPRRRCRFSGVPSRSTVFWDDVEIDETLQAVHVRRELEEEFRDDTPQSV